MRGGSPSIGRDGTVVVADTDHVKVKKYTAAGQLLWARAGKAFDVAVGPDGRVYVPDFQSKIVRVLSPTGTQIASWSGNFGFPKGIAVDPDGSVWVSDSQRGDVQHFTASGQLLGRVGSRSQLAQAGGVAVDAAHVYVADTDANRIKVWTKGGLFVGSYTFGGSPILGPMGLDIVGNRLFVAERTGERIARASESRSPDPVRQARSVSTSRAARRPVSIAPSMYPPHPRATSAPANAILPSIRASSGIHRR